MDDLELPRKLSDFLQFRLTVWPGGLPLPVFTRREIVLTWGMSPGAVNYGKGNLLCPHSFTS